MSHPLQNPLEQADSQKQKKDCNNRFSALALKRMSDSFS